MRSNRVKKLHIWVLQVRFFSVTFGDFHEVSSWKCQHAMKTWESGHRKRCVILSYNKFPLMYEVRGEDNIHYKGNN